MLSGLIKKKNRDGYDSHNKQQNTAEHDRNEPRDAFRQFARKPSTHESCANRRLHNGLRGQRTQRALQTRTSLGPLIVRDTRMLALP